MKQRFLRILALAFALALIGTSTAPALRAQAAAQPPAFTRELREGDTGDDVLALETRLRELLYFMNVPDTTFGPDTTAALAAFQSDHGLLASGMLDRRTHDLLHSAAAQPRNPFQAAADAMESGAAGRYWAMAPSPGYFIPEYSANEYNFFQENRFLSTATSPLSTFAADADTASYAQIRQMILRGDAVTKDAVRIEEMLNYFHYDYNAPRAGEPLGVTMELVRTPWNSQTQLLLIGLKAQEIPQEQRPPQNLVFLIDVSGSMDDPAKLPLVKRAFLLLLEQLAPTDTVSIVTYASMDAVLLDGVRASDRTAIADAIEGLSAGGMTAGAAGITTAYALAEKHFVPGGNNRVLLATDGDLNVGVSDEGSLARLVEEKKKAGVFLSVLGFGDGNYKDNKLEALADHGDGNYAYIDTIHEARRALVSEIGATFFTVAKDVKLQVDFNPAQVRGYRLIGYENRVMAAEDFADDQKDGGELGSGHRLTVLYEIVPIDSAFDFGETGSKYTQPAQAPAEGELLTLSIRAKEPDGDVSKLYEYPLQPGVSETMSDNVRFAAAVAQAGMLLRDSEWKGTATYANTLDLLRGARSISGDPLKEEFLYLVTLLERASAHGN